MVYRWHSDSDISSVKDKDTDEIDDNLSYLALSSGNTSNTKEKPTKQKIFIPKQHLWSRANSLKKAMREIIDHTEKGESRVLL